MTGNSFMEYRPEPWQQHAACRGYPTSWWYVEHEHRVMDFARKLCARCPVKQQCLDAALHRNEEGIWGGLTSHARGRIRSKNAGTVMQLRCAYCRVVFDADAQVMDRRLYCSGRCRRQASVERIRGRK